MKPEPVIVRADVDAILRGVFDIRWELDQIRTLLKGDDEEEEEEADA
jgi:hypothetical protein